MGFFIWIDAVCQMSDSQIIHEQRLCGFITTGSFEELAPALLLGLNQN
jgi:hypothetical protein